LVRIKYDNVTYDFDVRVIPNSTVENWVRFKIYPVTDDANDPTRKLLNADDALIIWKRDSYHYFSTNAVLVLNPELLDLLGDKISKQIAPLYLTH
jgi:hypothetical protein